jgi:hypothetical protein
MTDPISLGTRIDNDRFIAAAGTAEPPFVEALVDPAGLFRDPMDVVEHPLLTREEKRTILLSWARDELVLEQVVNGTLPELRPKSRIDKVIHALSRFDALAAKEYRAAVSAIRGRPSSRPCESRRTQSAPSRREFRI